MGSEAGAGPPERAVGPSEPAGGQCSHRPHLALPRPAPETSGFSPERGLTGLAHAAGPHHGDLDQPAARRPQAVVGGRGAARGGVLGDGAHVLNEAHRRSGRAAPRGTGAAGGRSSRCAGAGGGPAEARREEG